jgi:DNA gyrase subunit A
MSDNVIDLPVQAHMEKSFLDYSVSVIADRAIPDARDGLKPVHRRILFAMHREGLTPDKPFMKCATIVGRTMGELHPHGDVAIYDALVRLAQPWSLRHPLIEGHGNFGSMDNDPPAAMRYTEARMSKIATEFFATLGKQVVDTYPNFDGTIQQPTVLPVTFPNILVNGTEGIAVGMATSIPTHNLNEVVDAFLAYVADPTLSVADVIRIMPAPDFPTGGIVHGLDGYAQALETGRGAVKLRGEWHEEPVKGGSVSLVITELPWRVNKARLQEHIAELVRNKAIDDIVGITDSSARGQVRIVINLARGASAEVVANQLFAMTDLEISVSYNMMLLLGQQPMQMGVLDIFKHFLAFRLDVIKRAAEYDLAAAKKRLHIFEGYLKALDRLDETIALIRKSKDRETAQEGLIRLLKIDQAQAKAILELQLQRLTNMDIGQIRRERDELLNLVIDLENIIESRDRRIQIITDEANAVKANFGEERRTTIAQELSTITREDLIAKEDIVIIRTAGGYLKRVPVSAMNQQNRGTRGKSWMFVGEDDEVADLLSASTHDYLLAFTANGQLYGQKAYNVPESAAGTKGRHIRNVIDGLEGDIVSVMAVPDFLEDQYLLTVSKSGTVKRTALAAYQGSTRSGGIVGVKVEEGDLIVAADVVRNYDHVMIVANNGKAIRFQVDETQLRPMGRSSIGNRGIRLAEGEFVVGMLVLHGNGEEPPTHSVKVERLIDGTLQVVSEDQPDTSRMDQGKYLFVLGDRGVGKRTPVSEFNVQSRGGKGVACFAINRKTGNLIKALGVTEHQDVVLTSKRGVTNRLHVTDIRVTGRVAAGTILMRPDNGDEIVAVSTVVRSEEGN